MAETQVGPYRILERLGAGANGVVFLAEDTRLHRRVALKTLTGTAGSEAAEVRRKLLREARAAARLNHPNIAAVYDVLESDAGVHIVMEYVPGSTLAARVRSGPLPPMQVLDIALQLSSALAHAHELGVIHRDLKPANVMMSPSGRAKILDFGLARLGELEAGSAPIGSSDWTATDGRQVVGTPPYMPPELLRGEGYDARGDIYSLGVTLFELLTGRRPFEARDGIALTAAILTAPTPRPRSVAPDVPAELDQVVFRALARGPGDRWLSAREMESALERVAAGIAEPRTRSLVAPARSSLIGRRRWATGIAAIVVPFGIYAAIAAGRSGDVTDASRGVFVVLPLATGGSDRLEQSVAAGLADAVIAAASRIPRVTVVSRAATVDVLQRETTPDGIVRELGASLAMTGSVHRTGDDLRLRLVLSGAAGEVRWEQVYAGRAGVPMELQARAAAGAAAALGREVAADAGAGAAGAPAVDADAMADYGQGRAFLGRPDVAGNVDRSITLFQAAVAKDRRFARAHAGLGEAYFAKYRETGERSWADKARTATLEALRLDPSEPWVRYSLAVIYRETGHPREAVDELRRAIALQPANDEAHCLLGQSLAQLGEVEEGLAHIRHALTLRPGYWGNHQALGVVLYGAGRHQDALRAFQRVTELQPDTAWGYQMLGTTYHALGQRDLARVNYEKAIALGHARAHSNLGVLHYEEGRYAEAAASFHQAVTLEPGSPAKHRNLGDAYMRLGRRRDARAAYERAVDLSRQQLNENPGDPPTIARLAVYEAKLGQHAVALALIRQAATTAPASAEVLYRVAVVHALAGRSEDGVRALEQALQLGYSVELARQDEDLAALRGHEAYQRISSRQP